MKKTAPHLLLALSILSSSCSQLATREPADFKVASFPNLFGQNDKGFKLNEASKICLNQKNKSGFNPGFFGECGDLTSISEKKLKKLDFTGAQLKGAQLTGLNLSGLNLSGADLSYANLRGTNFKGSNLTNTKFQNAGIDDTTQGLSFTPQEIKKLGFLKDGAPVADTVAIAENEYGDLLTTQDFENVKAEFKNLAQSTERYHSKLISLVKAAGEIDTAHLNLILEVCYYKPSDRAEIIKKIDAEKDWEKRFALQEKEQEIRTMFRYNEEILELGLSKLNDPTLENLDILASQVAYSSWDIQKAFQTIIKKYISAKSADEVKLAIKILNRVNSHEMAASYGILLFNEHTQKTKEDLIAINALLENGAKDIFLESYLATVSTLTTDELNLYANLSYSYGSTIRANNIAKVTDLTEEKVVAMLEKVTYSSKDVVLKHYLGKVVTTISFDSYFKLLKLAYAPYDLINSFLSKAEGITARNIVSIIELVKYQERDNVAIKYMNEFAITLTTNELLAISKVAYSAKDELKYQNLSKISDLNPENATLLAKNSTYGNKDTLIIAYLNSAKEMSASEFIALVGASYEKQNEIALAFWKKITNVQANDVAKIASEVTRYNGKDLLMLDYLKVVKKVTYEEAVNLSKSSYDQKNEILYAAAPKVSNWGQEAAIALIMEAKYNGKDALMEYYLNSIIEKISTKNLISLTEISYNMKMEIRMKYRGKIGDYNIDNALLFSQALQYNDKDTVLKEWLDKNIKSLTTSELVRIHTGAYSYKAEMILAYHLKVVDFHYDNVFPLIKLLQYNEKDQVIANYLNKRNPLTTAQLQTLANASYSMKEQIVSKRVDLVTDLDINNALLLAKNFSYNQKDEFLLDVIKRIKNLTSADVVKISETSYDKKEELLKVGLTLVK